MELTAELKGDFELEAIEIATYSFDLGLEVNEMIKLENISVAGENPVSYIATVKKKEKFITRGRKGYVFGIYVFLEVADKENFEKIREALKKNS
jgi:hypothetical protein